MEKQVDKTTEPWKKPLVYRKERKFALTGIGYHTVEFWVKAHPAMFFRPFPPRFINNIYFDTPKFQNYGDNVVGAKNRYKFRIRWYGEQFGHVEKPVLEIKIKKGLAGAKRHFKLAPFTIQTGFSQFDMDKIFKTSNLPEEVREMLKYQSPALLNRYKRKYFLSADRKFRITLDNKLQYIRIARHQNSFLQRVSRNDKVIMELKYDTEYDLEANTISGYFPFRMTKNSKYVNGVDHLDAS